MIGLDLASRLRELLAGMAVDEHLVRSVSRASVLRAFEREYGSAWNDDVSDHANSVVSWARQRGDISDQRGGRIIPLASRALAIPEPNDRSTIRLIGTDIDWRIGDDELVEKVPVDDAQERAVGTEYLIRNTEADPQSVADGFGIPLLTTADVRRTLSSIENLLEWTAAEPNEKIITGAWNGSLDRFVPDAPGRWTSADAKPDEMTLLRRSIDDYGRRFEYRVFIPPDGMKRIDNAQAGLWRMFLLSRASEEQGFSPATITVNRFDRTVSVPPGIPISYERWLQLFGWKPTHEFHEGERVYHVPLGDLDYIVRPFVEHLGLERIDAN